MLAKKNLRTLDAMYLIHLLFLIASNTDNGHFIFTILRFVYKSTEASQIFLML